MPLSTNSTPRPRRRRSEPLSEDTHPGNSAPGPAGRAQDFPSDSVQESGARTGMARNVRRRTGVGAALSVEDDEPVWNFEAERLSGIETGPSVGHGRSDSGGARWRVTPTTGSGQRRGVSHDLTVGLDEDAGLRVPSGQPISNDGNNEQEPSIATDFFHFMEDLHDPVDELSPSLPTDLPVFLDSPRYPYDDLDSISPGSLVGTPQELGLDDSVEKTFSDTGPFARPLDLQPIEPAPRASSSLSSMPTVFLRPGMRFVGNQSTVPMQAADRRQRWGRNSEGDAACPFGAWPLDEGTSARTRGETGPPRRDPPAPSYQPQPVRDSDRQRELYPGARTREALDHAISRLTQRTFFSRRARYHPLPLPGIHDRMHIQEAPPELFGLSEADEEMRRDITTEDEVWSSIFSRHAAPSRDSPIAPNAVGPASFRRRRRSIPNFAELEAAYTPLAAAAAEALASLEREDSEWTVAATVTHLDWEAGKVSGIMQAHDIRKAGAPASGDDVPGAALRVSAKCGKGKQAKKSAVVTGFEGEIIDFNKRSLWTRKWDASMRTDLEYWGKSKPFVGLTGSSLRKVMSDKHSARQLSADYVLMRWKETSFINCEPHESGLTIQGFYYVSLSRSTGAIEAYYWDPAASPYQRLALKPAGHRGVAFGTMDLA